MSDLFSSILDQAAEEAAQTGNSIVPSASSVEVGFINPVPNWVGTGTAMSKEPWDTRAFDHNYHILVTVKDEATGENRYYATEVLKFLVVDTLSVQGNNPRIMYPRTDTGEKIMGEDPICRSNNGVVPDAYFIGNEIYHPFDKTTYTIGKDNDGNLLDGDNVNVCASCPFSQWSTVNGSSKPPICGEQYRYVLWIPQQTMTHYTDMNDPKSGEDVLVGPFPVRYVAKSSSTIAASKGVLAKNRKGKDGYLCGKDANGALFDLNGMDYGSKRIEDFRREYIVKEDGYSIPATHLKFFFSATRKKETIRVIPEDGFKKGDTIVFTHPAYLNAPEGFPLEVFEETPVHASTMRIVKNNAKNPQVSFQVEIEEQPLPAEEVANYLKYLMNDWRNEWQESDNPKDYLTSIHRIPESREKLSQMREPVYTIAPDVPSLPSGGLDEGDVIEADIEDLLED